jgi:CheY-like chemotaxis protein
MLEDLGHTAIGAESGSAALEILRDGNSIDLVITDQVMPEMTGLQLAQKIGAEWPELPIVLATGFAEIPSGAMKLPRLAKPFSQLDLALALVPAAGPKASGNVSVLSIRGRAKGS